MPVLIDETYAWKEFATKDWRAWISGHADAARDVFDAVVAANGNPDDAGLSRALKNAAGFYGLIAENGSKVFACADRVRSKGVFYAKGQNGYVFSNSARRLKSHLGMQKIDAVSRLEFATMGYVTGRETLYEGLFQTQGGEWVFHDATDGILRRGRYCRYAPDAVNGSNDAVLIDEFDAVNDAAFRRVMNRAGGAPIWVSLSGGLDSRFILCQLKRLGYENLHSYTYGPPQNDEAKIARHVAGKLGVPWTWAPSLNGASKRAFDAPERKRFWEYTDFLAAIPFLSDYQALTELKSAGKIPPDAVVIIGHSGDYITGGHLPPRDKYASLTFDGLFPLILKKHPQLWQSLLTPRNVARLRGKILSLTELQEGKTYGYDELSARYERWEGEERQYKYVINGQHVYDFFGLKWELPMWENEYFDFWRNVPARVKIGQRLYTAYLDKLDLYGLFRGFKPTVWRWPGAMMAVPVLAQPVKWLFGRAAADAFYKKFTFWGHYRNQYYPYGYRHFLSVAADIRNPVSLHVERWLKENLGEAVTA